jgi:hypothetical protein
MHTADSGYAAAHPSCMNLPALDEIPANVHAKTSIISLLASSIFVSDCFLLVRVRRAAVTEDTCFPRALRPENTTLLVSTAMLCSSTSSIPMILICDCVLLIPLANFIHIESDCSHGVRAYAELPH